MFLDWNTLFYFKEEIMLSALLKMSGFMILRIVYGKEKWKKESEGIALPMVLSLFFIFWLLCLIFLFSGSAANDFWICLIYGIAFPVVILVWAINVRKKQ